MELAKRAFAQGADIYISGDLKYHQAQDIEALGFALDVGHFSLEEKMMSAWARTLQQEFAELDRDVEVVFIPGRSPMTPVPCPDSGIDD